MAARTPEGRAEIALQLQVPTQPSVRGEGKGPAVETQEGERLLQQAAEDSSSHPEMKSFQ